MCYASAAVQQSKVSVGSGGTPRIVSKMALASDLTVEQETSVRVGYSKAAGLSVENVVLVKDTRRSVTYTVTMYVKDEVAATTVMNKFSDTSALKIALKDAVPDPNPAPPSTISSTHLHSKSHSITPYRLKHPDTPHPSPCPSRRVSPPPSQTLPHLRRPFNFRQWREPWGPQVAVGGSAALFFCISSSACYFFWRRHSISTSIRSLKHPSPSRFRLLDVASTYHNMGLIYDNQGKYEVFFKV